MAEKTHPEVLNADELNAQAYEYEAETAQVDYYNVPLEEFLHFAKLNREFEARADHGAGETAIPFIGFFNYLKSKRNAPETPNSPVSEKNDIGAAASIESGHAVELQNANRLLRNASWMSVFYLITTDILGPTSAPYAISQLGYVPGSLLYFLLGIAAAYSGVMLWRQFLTLDSVEYPLKNFGDVVGRIYGGNIRFGVDALQALQLLCNVAVIILGNGNGLSQIAKGKVCYAVLVFVWALAGMVVAQIKTLRRFGFLANLAIYMNVFVCIATMALAGKSGPNRDPAVQSDNALIAHDSQGNLIPASLNGPIDTKIIVSGSGNFSTQLNAVMNIVYAYGGAMMFIEFMAEMKRPTDFIKSMLCAEIFIGIVYLLFGLVTYAYQGRFIINPANQGINGYGWQTATNVISLVSALIAACLYGNVGIKVVYNAFLRKAFKLPTLESRYGRLIWTGLVIVYWALAYIIASAIPQFSTLTGLVGAVCILQFTYTFPPAMQFGLDMQLSAIKADGPYNPVTKQTQRIDNWHQRSRWTRAYKDKWFLNTLHILYFLAALTTAVLGIYSSALLLKAAYNGSSGPVKVVAFSCKSPVA